MVKHKIIKRRKDGPIQRYTVGRKQKKQALNTLDVSNTERKAIIKSEIENIRQSLLKENRVKVKDLGTFVVKVKPAVKGGKKVFMPMLGKEIITKSKPKRKVIKFHASKSLREAM